MNYISIFFMIQVIYNFINYNRLRMSISDRQIVYRKKNLIFMDLIYYLMNILYFIWLISIFFFGYLYLSLILLFMTMIYSIIVWKVRTNIRHEFIYSVLKIGLLFLVLIKYS